jgi:enoyl-CoA hydratase
MVVAGDQKAFAAGADIKEMAEKSVQEMMDGDPTAAFARIRALQKPVIAAVSGWALGGGCELALSCDMIVASESARFGLPEVTIGVIPGAGGTQRLPRLIGKALAMEIILNNRVLSAREALSFGMVNRVVPPERFLEEALELAGQVAGRAPLAARAAKKMINQAYELPLGEALEEERQTFYQLFSSEDQKEGMQAFIEKRPARWKGR